nr:helix-turn-helix transcriptional regulator [Micromonospora sp. DSM 115978]
MVNPTIQRRRLGNALKRAREAAGKTQEEAAEIIDAAKSKVSRLELGQSGLRLTDLNLLIDLYGVSGELADSMREMARAGRQRGRWSGYRNVVPDWFRQYLDLEADASDIRWYQPEVIPGILQIEPYVRAMGFGGDATTEHDTNRQVSLRLERQEVIDREDAPNLSFIVSESALRRNIGDAATMHEQLTHLAKLSRRRNVELQVFPFDAQTYQPSSFGFTILRFDENAASDVIYVEDYIDADYLDRPDAVRAYTRLWDRLRAAALGPVESRRLIAKLADEIRLRPT